MVIVNVRSNMRTQSNIGEYMLLCVLDPNKTTVRFVCVFDLNKMAVYRLLNANQNYGNRSGITA